MLLHPFDLENVEHLDLVEKLSNDVEVIKNVRNILFPTTDTYVISDDKAIGLLKINKELREYYSLDVAILEEYRNKKYGETVLSEAIKLINKYNKIIIRTKYDNKAAIAASLKSGFIYDNEEIEKCIDEGVNYCVLSLLKRNL